MGNITLLSLDIVSIWGGGKIEQKVKRGFKICSQKFKMAEKSILKRTLENVRKMTQGNTNFHPE